MLLTSPRLATAASIAGTLILVNPAFAHPEFNPVSTNRYVKFNLLGPTELRLAYTVMFGAAPALAARKEADANADGKLDDAETRALGGKLEKQVVAGLQLTVDGRPISPSFEAPAVGLAGAEVSPSPFSVDLVARVACPGAGPHEVRFDDRSELPALGETEVRIEEAPGTMLLSAQRGAESATATEKETRFLFRGPRFSALEDRSVGFRFAAAQPDAAAAPLGPVERRVPWRYFAVGAALALLLGLGVWRVRRKS